MESPIKLQKVAFFFGPTLVVLVLGLVFRWETFSRNVIALNPDEAEILAMSKNVDLALLGKDYTTSTFGPLLPYFFRVLEGLGVPGHLGGIHLVGFLSLLVFPLSVSFYAFTHRSRGAFSHILICVAFLQSLGLVYASKIDYLTLCTEIFPLVLTALMCLSVYSRSKVKDLLSGFIFSLIIFTKIQVIPLSLALYIALRISNFKVGDKILSFQLKWKSFMHFISGAAIGCLGIVLWLIHSGAFTNWLNQSLIFSFSYSTSYLGSGLGGANSILSKILGGLRLIFSDVVVSSILIFIVLTLFILLTKVFLDFRKLNAQTKHPTKFHTIRNYSSLKMACVIFGVFSTAFFAISFPGNLFPHYLLIMYAATTFALLYMSKYFTELDGSRDKQSQAKLSIGHAAGVMVLITVFNVVTPRTTSFADSRYTLSNSQIDRELQGEIATLQRFCPPKSQVLIWGWASEYFGYLDWTPTPNFINDANRLMASGDSSTTLKVLEKILEEGSPDCILSASGANYDFTTYSKGPSLLDYNPKFWDVILRKYTPVTIPSEAGLLWVKSLK
jgi:hypothetical protein